MLLGIVLGMIVGSLVGVFVMAVLVMASQQDDCTKCKMGER